MKTLFIKDVEKMATGENLILMGWVSSKRRHGKIVFINLSDSTGSIQLTVERGIVTDELYDLLSHLPLETAVKISGKVSDARISKEIKVFAAEIIGVRGEKPELNPRNDIDIFDPANTDHLLKNRHLYLRNPKVMAILNFRDEMMWEMRKWFHENKFVEISAPILTPIPLYDDSTAMPIRVHEETVFLTQCVGYYLEASVHAFERVYNIGPSFRGEESRSKRHLMEYWHIKAEMAFGNLDDIISIVENIVTTLSAACAPHGREAVTVLGTTWCSHGEHGPFPRITYREAVKVLNGRGFSLNFGESLSDKEEVELARYFGNTIPFWVSGIPRSVEPFPYVIDPSDPELTMVADLIASNGYGELLGTAEKISDPFMLDERMAEKNKLDDSRYEWIREVHQMGCVPHVAFGMGVERFIRWLLDIPHVRDAIPFPRIFRRKIYP